MKLTRIGSDYISINEDNIKDEDILSIPKIHLIKLSFFKPNKDKLEQVLSMFPNTNRYVIKNNIRDYNYFLKNTSKKYYIENYSGVGIISFLRKNNKILLNFHNLSLFERQFFLSVCFEDLLRNLEVIHIDNAIYKEKSDILKDWNGNVIISEKNEI
jgi:hypothetical protein